MRTKISFKGMILRLRQEKYRKNLAVFRCCDLGRQIVITRYLHSCNKYFFPAVPRNGFLSFIYQLRALRTKISFKRMILRLRQEKYRKNLAMSRCYDLGRQIVITR